MKKPDAKPHNTTKNLLLDVLWDWSYKGKMAVTEVFKWHSAGHLQTEQTLQEIATACPQGQGMAGLYQITTHCLPLLWGNQGADKDPTDFSPPVNQKSYPMNNNQKLLYTSLIKSGSVFTILISNTDESLTILSVAVFQFQTVHDWNIHNFNKSQRSIHAPN